MALVGAVFKLYQHVVDIPTAISLGIGAVIGALYGAKLVARVKTATLKALSARSSSTWRSSTS
ncbi:MAG: hypothetical protein AB1510_11985 [Bacillota bacterium]